jgi:hypothetical protein
VVLRAVADENGDRTTGASAIGIVYPRKSAKNRTMYLNYQTGPRRGGRSHA